MGLYNSTRLILTQLTNRIVECRISNFNDINEKVYISKIYMIINESKWTFVLKTWQFSLKICYAITTNKSQGQ